MLNYARRIQPGGLMPVYDNDWGVDCGVLQGGIYLPKGTVMGLFTGTGTAVNEKQTITINYTPTGGTFTITIGTLVITGVPYNATAAQVVTAINAVLGAGTVQATGGPLPGTPVVYEFINEAAGLSQVLAVATSALTGGTPGTVAITRSTVGKPAGGYFAAYSDANSDGTQVARRILQYDCSVDVNGNITFGQQNSMAYGQATTKAAPMYYKGYFLCSGLTGLDAAGVADLGKLTNATAYTDANAILCVTGA